MHFVWAGRGALDELTAASKCWLPPLTYPPASQRYINKTQSAMEGAARDLEAARTQESAASPHDAASDSRADAAAAESAASALAASSAVAADVSRDFPHAREAEAESGSGSEESGGCPYIGFTVSSNFVDAQNLWDASMSHSIASQFPAASSSSSNIAPQGGSSVKAQGGADPVLHLNQQAQARATATEPFQNDGAKDGLLPSPLAPLPSAEPLVLHVCGKFHCEDWLGIAEHLQHHMPDARVMVLVFEPSPESSVKLARNALASHRLLGRADYIVLTDANAAPSVKIEHPV